MSSEWIFLIWKKKIDPRELNKKSESEQNLKPVYDYGRTKINDNFKNSVIIWIIFFSRIELSKENQSIKRRN